uniref:Uncharacterized protein n=1 Tax=Arundo donax TaxID=35708 RepID=A0A0A9EW00_ARUDO
MRTALGPREAGTPVILAAWGILNSMARGRMGHEAAASCHHHPGKWWNGESEMAVQALREEKGNGRGSSIPD